MDKINNLVLAMFMTSFESPYKWNLKEGVEFIDRGIIHEKIMRMQTPRYRQWITEDIQGLNYTHRKINAKTTNS